MVSLAANISLESCREGGKETELSQPLAKQPAVHLCKCVLAIQITALLAEPCTENSGLWEQLIHLLITMQFSENH